MKVRYTSPAFADLEAIFDYIAPRSPQGAQRLQVRIQSFIDLLPLHPMIGTSTDDPTIRRLPTHPYPYLIFYEATDDEIIIHAVRHDARDPASMPGAPRS